MSYDSSNEDDPLLEGNDVGPATIPSSFSAQQSTPVSAVSKRLRACLGCRESKLRCKRSEENPHLGCERCLASRRECIIPTPRKREKKTGKATVAVLEKRIDALLSSLTEKREYSENDKALGDLRLDTPHVNQRIPFVGEAGSRRTYLGKSPEGFEPNQTPLTGQPFDSPESLIGGGRDRNERKNPFAFFTPRPPRTDELFQKDVVSQGYVSLEDAERVYNRFIKSMLPHFPAIVLPEEATVVSLRRTKPALFLSILAVGSGILGQEMQKFLTKEAMSGISERVFMRGEKNLDLVQAIQLSVVWHYPPDNFEEIRFYQPVCMAAAMCLELGLGQEPRPSVSRFPSLGIPGLPNVPAKESKAPADTPADGKRAWLVSYFLCGIVAMTTRRPTMLRWSPYMDSCIDFLEGGGNTLESDKFLCQWVRGQHLSEEICHNFSMDDPSAEVDSVDVKLQYVIGAFEQQLNRWQVQIAGLPSKPPLQSHFNIVNLYLHEIVLHVGHNINDFRPPFMEEMLQPPESPQRTESLTAMQRSSLATCVISAHNVLDIFLGYDGETIGLLPVFNFVRVAYAAVVLMKIHGKACRSESDSSSFIDMEDLNTEAYLQRLVEKLQGLDIRRQGMASVFYVVLQMLQMWFDWFRKRCQNDAEGPVAEEVGGENSSGNEFPTNPSQPSTLTTPLGGLMGSPNVFSQHEPEPGDMMDVDFEGLMSGIEFDTHTGLFLETAMGWLDEFI